KGLKFYVVDGYKVAEETGMGRRINTIMQTCFFALLNEVTGRPLLTREKAIEAIKEAIRESYNKRGELVVQQNFAAVDAAISHMHRVPIPEQAEGLVMRPATVPEGAPEFVRTVTARIMAGEGDSLPVSLLPVDGTYPSGTTRWEKRNIATEIPVWDPEICIQCGKC